MALRRNQKGFHLIPILLFLIVLGVVVFAGFKVFKKDDSNNKDNVATNSSSASPASAFLEQYKSVCKDRDVSFTSAPLKLSQLGYIRPLGAVGDGHVTPTDHVYVGPTNPEAADNTFPVLMPADGTVVQISRMPAEYIGDRTDTKVAPEDHRLVISHSCRYFSIYIHVHKLSDKLASAAGNLQPNESKMVSVELNAGETVGYIGGQTFDWTPVDTQSTLKGFITPSFYNGEPWKIHTVSPFDLYTGSLKKTLEAKSFRQVAPIGGKIDYDQAGKLIGNWFRQGSGGYAGSNKDQAGRYWDGHLSVAPDYVDPSKTIVSIGNWQGVAKQFAVKGSVDSSKIGVGTTVKYELLPLSYMSSDPAWHGSSYASDIKVSQGGELQGTILFQVLSGEKLKVEKFPGKTASQINDFTSAAQIYER